jgi:hypothetical protein
MAPRSRGEALRTEEGKTRLGYRKVAERRVGSTELRISAHADHPFRFKPTTYFAPWRPPISAHAHHG